MIFGANVSPLPSGTSTRSRGIETIETVWPTGSSEMTISESVSAWVRVRPGVDPHEQDVDPLAWLRRRPGGRARVVVRPAGRVAAGPGEDRSNVEKAFAP